MTSGCICRTGDSLRAKCRFVQISLHVSTRRDPTATVRSGWLHSDKRPWLSTPYSRGRFSCATPYSSDYATPMPLADTMPRDSCTSHVYIRPEEFIAAYPDYADAVRGLLAIRPDVKHLRFISADVAQQNRSKGHRPDRGAPRIGGTVRTGVGLAD